MHRMPGLAIFIHAELHSPPTVHPPLPPPGCPGTGCPFCRKVREAVAILDLDVEFRPCPQASTCASCSFWQLVLAGGAVLLLPLLAGRMHFLLALEDSGGLCGSPAGAAVVQASSAHLPKRCWLDAPAHSLLRLALTPTSPGPALLLLQGGPTWRPEAAAKGGKARFPYIEDPNTGTAMYESDDIIRYLFEKYGPGADKVRMDTGAGSGGAGAGAGLGMLGGAGAGPLPLLSALWPGCFSPPAAAGATGPAAGPADRDILRPGAAATVRWWRQGAGC